MGHLIGTERHLYRANIIFEVSTLFGTGDRHEVWSFVQQPGERDLSRRHALPHGEFAHRRRSLHVRIKVLALITGIAATEITFRILLGTFHMAG